MGNRAIFAVILAIVGLAYFNAHHRLTQKIDLHNLHLNMPVEEVEDKFGAPYARERNVLTYVLDDSSQLTITLRDDVVASAMVKYRTPIKLEDPKMRRLTLVQMSSGDLQDGKPSWFFAGKPSEGLIYKITQNGEVESLTWVPPFIYGNNQPKNLQALLSDFKSQNLSNL